MTDNRLHPVLFVTGRSERHQRAALAAAPPVLDIRLRVSPSAEELQAALTDTEYLISERVGRIDAATLTAAPRLRLIQRLGMFHHDIDLQAAHAAGIAVCRWPIPSVIRVAEHLLLQMLALGRHWTALHNTLIASVPTSVPAKATDGDHFRYNWSGQSGLRGLYQSTVAILGFGEVGHALAQRLHGFGCRLLYHKRHRLPRKLEQCLGIEYAKLHECAERADFLCNLLPLDQDTRGLIDRRFIRRMPTHSFLVSCGPGAVVDEAAAAEALREGHLKGVAMDSFGHEPLAHDAPLLAAARAGLNAQLSPHVAAGDSEDPVDRRRADFSNILRHLNAQPLLHQLLPEAAPC